MLLPKLNILSITYTNVSNTFKFSLGEDYMPEFKLIEKLITQFGISIIRINISVITKSAKNISDIGLLPSAAIIQYSSERFGQSLIELPQ